MKHPFLPITVAVCLAGVGCDQSKTPAPADSSSSAEVPSEKPPVKPGMSSALGGGTPKSEPAAASASTTAAPAEPSPEEVAKTVEALQKIDAVLRDSSMPPAKAGLQLAELASDSAVPLQNRTEALQHAMNLLPDDSFGALDGLLSAKDAPVSLQDLVFNEVHNRPVTTQLPVALTLLKSPDPDVSSRARSLLAFHLDRDYGDDLDAWTQPVQEAIAKAKGTTPPAQ
jgi:hypothetical protein